MKSTAGKKLPALSRKAWFGGEYTFGAGDVPRPRPSRIVTALAWLFMPISLITLWYPIAFLGMLSVHMSIYAPPILLFAWMTNWLTTRISWNIEALSVYWDLVVNYLHRTLRGICKIESVDLIENMPPESRLALAAARMASMAVRTRLARLYILHPKGIELAERKGFSIPVGASNVNGRPLPDSMIFIRDHPRRLTPTGLYQLYHEVGHSTKHAWRARVRFHHGTMSSIVITLWLFCAGAHASTSIAWGMTYFLARVGIDGYNVFRRYRSLVACDEIVADKFALQHLPRRLDFNFLRKSVVDNLARTARSASERRRVSILDELFVHRLADRRVPLDNTWDTLPPVIAVVASGLVILSLYFVVPTIDAEAFHRLHMLLLSLIAIWLTLQAINMVMSDLLEETVAELSVDVGIERNKRPTAKTLTWLFRFLQSYLWNLKSIWKDGLAEGYWWVVLVATFLLLIFVGLAGVLLWFTPTWYLTAVNFAFEGTLKVILLGSEKLHLAWDWVRVHFQ